MANTLIKNTEVRSSFNIGTEGNVYLLPKREKIKTFSCSKCVFLFSKKYFKEHLYKKFSLKTRVEKYEVENENGFIDARMDLKVYSDNVYIINLDVAPENFNAALAILLQSAAEKALYNTTDKKVFINLSLPFSVKNKVKNIIKKCGYVASSQRKYEKEILGEEFYLDLKKPSNLNALLKSSRFYLNK